MGGYGGGSVALGESRRFRSQIEQPQRFKAFNKLRVKQEQVLLMFLQLFTYSESLSASSSLVYTFVNARRS